MAVSRRSRADILGGMEPSDVDLLRAWRSGDRTAGQTLFARHVTAVVRFFRNKVGDNWEDLAQHTFLRCVEARDRLHPDSNIRAYLLTIARRELIRYHQKNARTTFDPLQTSLVALQASPSVELDARDRDAALLYALACLPLDLQIVLELFYWERMGVEDLATIVDVPVGTVKTRLLRARRMLRDQIQKTAMPRCNQLDDTEMDTWARSVRDRVGGCMEDRSGMLEVPVTPS